MHHFSVPEHNAFKDFHHNSLVFVARRRSLGLSGRSRATATAVVRFLLVADLVNRAVRDRRDVQVAIRALLDGGSGSKSSPDYE
jgi:hypothetical protein